MWICSKDQEHTFNTDFIKHIYLDGNLIKADFGDTEKLLGAYSDFSEAENKFKMWKAALINNDNFFNFKS